MADVVVREREVSLVRLDPQALISQAIGAGADIATMERLVALAKDVREVQAKEAWYEAMAEFQRQCPPIKKTKKATIATSRATYSYTYAPLDEILSVVQPVMGPLGLSISWKHRLEGDKVIANCWISHTLGHHEESGEIPMPIIVADAERGANPMQRIGIATTYAKRYTLLAAIGMAPEDDDDAAGAEASGGGQGHHQESPAENGAVITEPQSKRFWAIAREHKWSDEQVKDLLTSFGREHTKDVLRSEYDAIVNKLKAGPPAKAPQPPTQERLA